MNKLTTFFSGITIAILASTAAYTVNAAENDNYADMHKQLKIMGDIIKSSVPGQKGKKHSRVTGVESIYLKGQGVVFTINSRSHSNRWGNFNFNFVMPEIPVAPVGPNSLDHDSEFEIEIDDMVAQSLESATEGFERAMVVFEHDRDGIRELREEQRDLAHDVRSLEREKRDLAYQMKRASEEDQKQLKAELKQLEQQKAKLAGMQKEMATKTAELQKQHKVQMVQNEESRNLYYQKLTSSLTETLCLYGNGLKALPKNEYVSVILKSAGERIDNRYKDSILVFSKKDIGACSNDKMNTKALLEKANVYQF